MNQTKVGLLGIKKRAGLKIKQKNYLKRSVKGKRNRNWLCFSFEKKTFQNSLSWFQKSDILYLNIWKSKEDKKSSFSY
jgi:hypothetical protein